MSTVDELLDGMSSDPTGLAPEEHIVVGSDRFITVPASLRRIAVEGDKDVETLTFDCPRYWDDGRLDLSTMEISINYMRSDGGVDKYVAYDAAVDEDDPTVIHFTWIISEYAAAVKGSLSFLICAKLANEDGEEIRHWNSELNTELIVSAGLEVDEAIVSNYPSIIIQILSRLENIERGGGGTGNVPNAQKPIISEVVLAASNWVGSKSPYSQVVNIEGVTANSQVDLTPSVEQLAIFYQKDLGFVTENNNGVVTVYAIGDKPANDYTIQVTITEVTV
jgi:hypothetical protein